MKKIPNRSLLWVCMALMSFCACTSRQASEKNASDQPVNPRPSLSREVIYDRVLGALLGSAIGDAMGAPTEMWSRDHIRIDYGFVDKLDTMVREPSAEGTWDYNLPAGGTTDDTRWKKLMIDFLLTQNKGLLAQDKHLDPQAFARHILRQYQQDRKALKETDSFDPGPFEANARKMAWLQEWALVAHPYAEQNWQEYHGALDKFYGGEMTCAGMLFAPAVGAYFPGAPLRAYEETYRISIFDIGYARDISGLTAALVSAAITAEASPESVLNVIRDVDPHHYFKSRLVGRAAYRLFKEAKSIVYECKQMQAEDIVLSEMNFPQSPAYDTLFLARMQQAYTLLDQKNQDMPFHAGEIFLVNLTALLFCDFDFEKSMAFIVNYGRDNDTTAAVTGAILGAYWGARQLPKDMVAQVLAVNTSLLDNDLEALASQLTDKILGEQGNS